MGTTPRGYRYPEPVEKLGNVHAHIRTLAEDVNADVAAQRLYVDGHVAASYCHCDKGSAADLGVAAGANALVPFGVLAATAEWAQTQPDTFVYSGPNRLVQVSAIVRVSASAPPDNQFNVKAAIINNGQVDVEHHEALTVTSVDPNLAPVHTFNLSTVVGLQNGYSLQVRVANSNGYSESINVQALGRSLKMTAIGLY